MSINRIQATRPLTFRGKNESSVEKTTQPPKKNLGKKVLENALIGSAVIGAGYLATSCEKDEIEPNQITDTLYLPGSTDTVFLPGQPDTVYTAPDTIVIQQTDTLITPPDTIFETVTDTLVVPPPPPVTVEFNSLKEFQNEYDIPKLQDEGVERVIIADKDYKLVLGGTEYYEINDNEPVLFMGESKAFNSEVNQNNTDLIINNDEDNIIIASGYNNLTTGNGDNKVIISGILHTKLGDGDDDLDYTNLSADDSDGYTTSISLGHGNNKASITYANIDKIEGGNDKDDIYLYAGSFGEVQTYKAADIVKVDETTAVELVNTGDGEDYVSNDPKGNSYIGDVRTEKGDDKADLVNIGQFHGGDGDDVVSIDGSKLVMMNDGNDILYAKNIDGHVHLGYGDDFLDGENIGNGYGSTDTQALKSAYQEGFIDPEIIENADMKLKSAFGDPGNDYIIVKNVDGDLYPHYGNNVIIADNVSGHIHLENGKNVLYSTNNEKILSPRGGQIIYHDDKVENPDWYIKGDDNIINGIPQTPTSETYTQEYKDNFFKAMEEQYGDDLDIVKDATEKLDHGWSIPTMKWFYQRVIHPILGIPITPENMDEVDKC